MDISNFYVACLWSVVFFLLLVPAGYLSFRFIDAPFLKHRKRYIAGLRSSQETFSHAAHQGAPADALQRTAEL